MMYSLFALVSGLLFGIGLSISHMVDPAKVQNFLDITGHWDPSLLFVMLGALPVAFLGYHFTLKRQKPIFDQEFHLPTKTTIDKQLVLGACIFGIGWGLSGYCPGPTIVGLGSLSIEAFIMVPSVYLGFVCHRYVFK